MNWIHYRYVIHAFFGFVGGFAALVVGAGVLLALACIMDGRGPGNRPMRRSTDDQDNIENH